MSYQGSFNHRKEFIMIERRKDNKGRVLKTGESQRKDLIYQYRYTDKMGKRQTVYAGTLTELRKKEDEITRYAINHSDYSKGKITVISLLEKYVGLKQGVRYNTRIGYNYVMNIIKKEEFGYRQIKDIKTSDAQLWIIKLHNDGKGYSAITSIRGVVKPAFQMAVNEDIIPKNPFDFKLVEIVPNDSKRRIALTDEQQKLWMDFIKNDNTYQRCYDEFVVLLETGMRVSEFCGLTKNDLDFENNRIRVDHQLVRERGGKYYVEKTKTECGQRFIPMTDNVRQSLQNILLRRQAPKPEIVVDGYSGFILIDKDLHPKVALHIENDMRWAMKKYEKFHPDKPLPNITPHVFRHTFCTNMVNAGMDVKTLQYLMGHSDVGVTLNVYTHITFDRAAEQMKQIFAIKN